MDNFNAYAEAHTSAEGTLLQELRRTTQERFPDAGMLSGFFQGRFLAQLSKMLKPRRVLEIGTYVGYSALCLAEGLTPDGKIITLDIDEIKHDFARSFFEQSPYRAQIEQMLGNAPKIIPHLDEVFDLVFIDADKSNYSNYYNLVFENVRVGGYILADNVWWSGKVLDAVCGPETDADTRELHEFNQMIKNDGRVSHIMLPIRDGLMLIRKESKKGEK